MSPASIMQYFTSAAPPDIVLQGVQDMIKEECARLHIVPVRGVSKYRGVIYRPFNCRGRPNLKPWSAQSKSGLNHQIVIAECHTEEGAAAAYDNYILHNGCVGYTCAVYF
jgi:hypothetical protein